MFYQKDGGWETDAYGLTMRFNLVDIVGLVSERSFEPPAPLPTTLSGWIAAIVRCLGENFADRYIVDAPIDGLVLTAAADSVSDLTCGELLRYACMAAGAYSRADSETGYLRVSPLEDTAGTRVSLDNMYAYPQNAANDELADITFRFPNGDDYLLGGTLTASGRSIAVENPFITTPAEAQAAARNIIAHYGGRRFTVQGRGDMASELGDIDVLETGFGAEVSARRFRQQLKLENGVMARVQSVFLQSSGLKKFSQRVALTGDGSWTAPGGVRELRLILVAAGSPGERGQDGTYSGHGNPGAGGAGGRVWTGIVQINEGQIFNAHIGTNGGATTLGAYSSANGNIYDGWGDVQTGDVYGLTGAEGRRAQRTPTAGNAAATNTGNGGQGGSGGYMGIIGVDDEGGTHIKSRPVAGGNGGAGGSGIIIIYYDTGGA